MTTPASVVQQKYTHHLNATFGNGDHTHHLIALFVLQLALSDLDEAWQDEYTNCLQKLEDAQALIAAQTIALEALGKRLADESDKLDQVQALCDALEAECTELRKKIDETGTAQQNGDTPNPLPSAAKRNPPTGTAQEVGDTTTPNPIDWPTVLADLLTPEQIQQLENRETRWYQLGTHTQNLLVMRIATTIHQHLGTISQNLYRKYMPSWATSTSSWQKTCPLTWRQVLNNLGVTPSSSPHSKRSRLTTIQE